MSSPLAVVTGASSGIGAATARTLAKQGFHVVSVARRKDRLDQLVAEIGGTALECDVTNDASVAELARAVDELDGELRVLVNNAGGARGLEPVEQARVEDWRWMYEVNVLGVLRVTKALLPALEASGDGHVVVVSSTAGHGVYEGGAGYTGAKHAVVALRETLRLEVVGRPIRVSEVAPGMVATEEFSLNRFAGDSDKAAAVYEGVPGPLVAEDIADAIAWVVSRPSHVNVDLMVVRPRAQASNTKVHRE
ncbi:MAG: SDR family oxidoreductase [Corynebacteriales bacterium]|nr:SDR family oxidoreductase [Mycobacteriales bacterium]